MQYLVVKAAREIVVVELHGEHGREQWQQLHKDWVVNECLVGVGANTEATSQNRGGKRKGEHL